MKESSNSSHSAARHFVRKRLIDTAHFFERLAKQLRGAADKVIPEKRIFLLDLEKENWRSQRPCFVLSTGRCGTALLNDLLLLSPNADPNHGPLPELFRPSRRAYEEIDRHPEIFREVFKSAREEYVLKAARQDKIYIETNNQSSFFAPVIPDIFPNAVFIHLVRHPGSFVRSGIRRKWYTGDHSHDIGRIVPKDPQTLAAWEHYSPIEKNGWLWNETNQFIEDFLKTLPKAQYLFVKAEALFRQVDVTRQVYDFIGLQGFSFKKVEKVIQTPVNVQKKGSFPPFKEWPEADRQALKAVVPLAQKYGYQL